MLRTVTTLLSYFPFSSETVEQFICQPFLHRAVCITTKSDLSITDMVLVSLLFCQGGTFAKFGLCFYFSIVKFLLLREFEIYIKISNVVWFLPQYHSVGFKAIGGWGTNSLFLAGIQRNFYWDCSYLMVSARLCSLLLKVTLNLKYLSNTSGCGVALILVNVQLHFEVRGSWIRSRVFSNSG